MRVSRVGMFWGHSAEVSCSSSSNRSDHGALIGAGYFQEKVAACRARKWPERCMVQ